MMIGNPAILAIESSITTAYERLSFRGLGFFVIHVGGRRYGVYAPDVTLLACSYEEVRERVARRGAHLLPQLNEVDASAAVEAILLANFGEDDEREVCGMSVAEFHHLEHAGRITWAPDGDEAFDDRSYVFHFDVGDRVRLIAFTRKGFPHDPETLREVWLDGDEFYGILQRWADEFETEWARMPKVPCSADGAEA